MKATIGIYETQQQAFAAIDALKKGGFKKKQISLIHRVAHPKDPKADGESGEGPGIDSDEVYSSEMKVAGTTTGIGAAVGTVLGVLAGVGVLAIPGLGILVGAGAVAGAFAGLDAGIIGGGIISGLAIAGMNEHHEKLYHEHLEAGHYLVMAHGNEDEITKAHKLLDDFGQHLHIAMHQ